MAGVPASHRWARRIAIVSFAVLTILLIAWIRTDPRVNLETDWTSFDNAASRLLAGEQVYVPISETEPLPYLYPPFTLLLALPLGLFGFYGSWVLAMVMTAVPFIAGLRLLARNVSDEVIRKTGLTVAIFSGTLFSATLIGQYSGIYVFAFGLALYLWQQDREFLAGLALAILVMKPNIAIAVPVILVWSRSGRALRGFGLGTLGALALSLPFGLHQWSAFVDNVRQMGELQADGFLFSEKMITIVGSLEATFGLRPSDPLTIGLWVLSTLIVGVATLTVWTRPQLAVDPIRAFGVLAIFSVIANPRMYFYDASLVVFGALAIWFQQRHTGGPLLQRWVTPLCCALWFFSWGGPFVIFNAFVGPLAAVLLVIVAIDARDSRELADADITHLEPAQNLDTPFAA